MVEALLNSSTKLSTKPQKKKCAPARKDKQLPRGSRWSPACHSSEKVAGEAGEEVPAEIAGKIVKPAAEKAVGFLAGLLTGDPKAATKGITKDDFIDV